MRDFDNVVISRKLDALQEETLKNEVVVFHNH